MNCSKWWQNEFHRRGWPQCRTPRRVVIVKPPSTTGVDRIEVSNSGRITLSG
jgi:hypothetical protein